MPKSAVFPYVFPLQAGSGLFCALKQGFHAVRRIPFHALRCMGVNIQRERRRRVAKVFLHDFRAVARLQGIDSERMPLRYNNDKQKKPLFSRGLSVCRLLFNSFSKLKIDENYKEKRRLFY